MSEGIDALLPCCHNTLINTIPDDLQAGQWRPRVLIPTLLARAYLESGMDEIRNLISYFESEVRQHDSCLTFARGQWRADLERYRTSDLAVIASPQRRFAPL